MLISLFVFDSNITHYCQDEMFYIPTDTSAQQYITIMTKPESIIMWPTQGQQNILSRGFILVSKLLGQGYLHGNFILRLGNNSMVVIHNSLCTNLTLLSICWRVLPTDCSIWLVSSYFVYFVTGVTCGVGNAYFCRNTWFHFYRGVYDFTHFYDIYYIYIPVCVLSWGQCLRIRGGGGGDYRL